MMPLILAVYFFSKAFLSNVLPLQINRVCGRQPQKKKPKESASEEQSGSRS